MKYNQLVMAYEGSKFLYSAMIAESENYDDVAVWDISLPDGKHTVRYVLIIWQNYSPLAPSCDSRLKPCV